MSESTLKPISVNSLKEEFIRRFEDLILTGTFKVGERLPSERDLARQLQVSRPVVHEGLVDLATKGLVTLYPRKGTVVNDYRRDGSMELLVSLFLHTQGTLDPKLLSSILQMRLLIEIEIARLCALSRTTEDKKAVLEILKEERDMHLLFPEEIAVIDYKFHHALALASGNTVYPLLMNSLKPLYLGILNRFYADKSVVAEVQRWHRRIASAIFAGLADKAVLRMRRMLEYSERELYRILEL